MMKRHPTITAVTTLDLHVQWRMRKWEFLGSEPKFAEPVARPPGAVLRTAAKLVSDPNNLRRAISAAPKTSASRERAACGTSTNRQGSSWP